jgi:hypothetical protein
MYYFAYGINLNKKQMASNLPAKPPAVHSHPAQLPAALTGWTRQWRGGIATVKRSAAISSRRNLRCSGYGLGKTRQAEDCPGNFERIKVIGK